MKADNFDTPTNPYHYVLHCIGGKWKMTILHEIYTYGSIRFNQTLKILPISEKVFSQQLKELVEAGLIAASPTTRCRPRWSMCSHPAGSSSFLPWTYSISGVSARCTTAESPSMRMPL